MLTDVSSESVSAILPLYITGFLGLSTIAFGILDGINQGASAIVRIAAGYASDRIGRPKRVAVAGYGLSMVARIGLLFASGFWALTAVVTADRIGKGIRTAPRDALIAVSAQPEYLARHFGVHRMLDNIGAAGGPLLAFLILMLIPNGYGTVFVVSLAFAAIGVAVLALLVPNLRTRRTDSGGTGQRASRQVAGRQTRPAWGFRWRLLREPGLGRLLVAAGILGLLTVGDGFIYLVLQDRDSFAVQWFPLLYVGTNVVFLLLAIPLGRLADRWGKARVFIARARRAPCLLPAGRGAGRGIRPDPGLPGSARGVLRRDGRGAGGAGEPTDPAGQTCHRARRRPDRGGAQPDGRLRGLWCPLVRAGSRRGDGGGRHAALPSASWRPGSSCAAACCRGRQLDRRREQGCAGGFCWWSRRWSSPPPEPTPRLRSGASRRARRRHRRHGWRPAPPC